MPSDTLPDPFTRSANGTTAGSYLTDGKWNIGGWATYPSAAEIAISSPARAAALAKNDPPRR